MRGLGVAGWALTALLCGGCYLEGGGSASGGDATGLVGQTCRLGVDMPTAKDTHRAMSRDGLLAAAEIRGTVRSVGGGLIQVDTGKSLLWVPLERVLYIEREK